MTGKAKKRVAPEWERLSFCLKLDPGRSIIALSELKLNWGGVENANRSVFVRMVGFGRGGYMPVRMAGMLRACFEWRTTVCRLVCVWEGLSSEECGVSTGGLC